MTLIIPFFSDDFVALVSDRRITWQIGGATQSFEDTENKAIVLAGHFLLGYTGFARLGGIPTDKWVVQTLTGIEPNDYFPTLARETGQAVDALSLPLERSGHAFVAVGYGRFRSEPDKLVPSSITVSNAVGGGYGTWNPRREFHVTRGPRLASPDDFRMSAFGIVPRPVELNETIGLIRRYRRRYPSRMVGVVQLIARMARSVADRDDGVGDDLSVSVLPKVAVPASEVALPLHGPQDPIEQLTCVFLPAGQEADQALAYAPATIAPGIATWGGEIWTEKPPWWDAGRGG